MSASHSDSLPEKDVENSPNASAGHPETKAGNPETKILDHDAPYKHAPPKDGDPWTTVLTPELEADTVRCTAWKEEVQNLLIFAGLFSAVVTTFVIESYTFLQPDPNAAIVGLLFQIANGLNATSSLPPSVNPEFILAPFTQTASAIRINVFWFISLILSLTTVLAGTIALQWLREHQSYVGYSGKEKLAILHMRKAAAEAWYLPQVFAALPLLLQAALVLFLAGLIDFSRPLGLALTIPISVVIGLVLLFLTATTILPSLQGLCFFFGLYPQETLPTPCPYKSPQSDAFRSMYGVFLRAIFRFFPAPSPSFENDHKSHNLKWVIKNRPLLMPDHLAPSVYDLWNHQTWITFDREWLSLRDACHQRLLDDDPDLFHHRLLWKRSFPLSDVTKCLVKAVSQTPGTKHTESYLAALVHCFQELSESIWTTSPTLSLGSDIQRIDRRNHYFEQLHWNPSCSMSKFLLHGGIYKFERFDIHYHGLHKYMEPKITQRLFCDDQTVTFLRMLLEHHSSPVLARYQLELWSRILQSSSHVAPLTPTGVYGSFVPVPTIIEFPLIHSMMPEYLSDQRISTISNVLSTLLKLAASHRITQDETMNSLCTHSHMVDVLNSLAYLTTLYLRLARRIPGISHYGRSTTNSSESSSL
ncbi:hypothetical protein BJ912DRAFT_389975 [Pholiota molesta]|nr:hypothetical protein BJ912DRAFT_389975 [Pholiota molesta]